MKGADVSNWNTVQYYPGYDFIIAKATQGTFFKDPTFTGHIQTALDHGQKIGAYHFADPATGTTPEQEAAYFVETVRPYLGRIFMFLDWEASALNYGASWALQWLKEVERLTGIKPGFYTSASVVWNGGYKAIADNQNALWIAQYTNAQSPTMGASGWPFWALWQYSDKPIDQDVFNGDAAAWDAYCKGSKPKEPDKPKPKPEPALEKQKDAVYRLYNPNSGGHYFTGNFEEAKELKAAGWKYEGIGWHDPATGTIPVYVLYNERLQDHVLTTDSREDMALIKAGWIKQAPTFASAGNIPVYRLYNPNAKTGQHTYTISNSEVTGLVKAGWLFEGVSFYSL